MGSTKEKIKVTGNKKTEKEEPKKEEKKKHEVRHDIPKLIIRFAGTDLDGEKLVIRALRKIKGIGIATSSAICLAAKVNPSMKLGALTESEITNLENVIKNPTNFGVPIFLVNRRKDPATGTDIHLTSSDLDIARRFDVQRYIDLRTYRGWRHMLGQPVRGQRTRSTFRQTGRTVGVMKKTALQKGAPAPTTAAKPEAKSEKK